METTDKSKKMLRISIAVSIVLCSLSIFIFSLNFNPANASSANTNLDNNYKIVGVINDVTNDYIISVIGYNEVTGSVKVIATE